MHHASSARQGPGAVTRWAGEWDGEGPAAPSNGCLIGQVAHVAGHSASETAQDRLAGSWSSVRRSIHPMGGQAAQTATVMHRRDSGGPLPTPLSGTTQEAACMRPHATPPGRPHCQQGYRIAGTTQPSCGGTLLTR
jgi:hypothetical protein